jgi:hypothetical protein
MNAKKRLEEFISKLSIKQGEPGLFNIINDLKMSQHCNNILVTKDNYCDKNNHKSTRCINDK